MYLKTLTIRGFKSFASATTFEFEPGVTAVVGPNGSGKSNVVDALAWVMGEQGAKNLRGGKMEDVIFAGTSGRSALGRAQVSLTIDNSDGALPIDYSEVTISRTLFRSGGSEYAINGNNCRLLDIQELLSDSGLGREMHVIVGQGQLDRILQATPEERRGFIEEASGILKHRRRKERSVRKLDSMRTNLDRVRDLTEEVRRQLGPLSRQAATARKAQRIQFDVRDARARLLADEIVTQTSAVEAVAADDADISGRLESATRRQEQAEAEGARLAAVAKTAAEAATAARNHWYELSNLLERYRSLEALNSERLRAATAPVPARKEIDPDTAEAHAADAQKQAEDSQSAVKSAEKILDEATANREDAERAARIAADTYTQLLQRAADRRQAVAVAQGAVDTTSAKVDALLGQRDAADAELERFAKTVEEHQGQLESWSDPDEAGESTAALEQEAQSAQERVTVLRKGLADDEKLLSEARSALSSAVTRREVLQDGLRPDTGSALSVLSGSGTVDLTSLVSVVDGWERAVTVALGEGVEQLWVSNQEAVGAAVDELVSNTGGDARLLYPVSKEALSKDHKTLGEGIHSVDDIFSARPEAPNGLLESVRTALSDVLFVVDLDTAYRWWEENPDVRDIHRLVTPHGHVIGRVDVTVRGHDVASTLETRAAADAAEVLATERARDVEQAQQQRDHAARDLDDAVETERRLLAEVQQVRMERAAASERWKSAQRSLSQAQQQWKRASDQRQDLEARLDEAQQRLVLARERLEAAQGALDVHDSADEIGSEEASFHRKEAAEKEASRTRTEETEARLVLRTAEGVLQQAVHRAEQSRRRVQAALLAQQEEQRSEARRRRSIDRLSAVESAITQAIERVDAAVQQAEDDRRELEDQRAELDRQRREANESAEAARKDVSAAKDEAHARQMAHREQQLKLEQLHQRAQDELGYTEDYLIDHFGPELPVPLNPPETIDDFGDEAVPADISTDAVPFDREEQAQRLRRAQRQLTALGKVNPLALEEYAAVEERHKYLSEQLADLEQSRKDLLQIIADVDATVLRVFESAYRDTAAQFQHVFATLFPGGEGRLSLTEPDNLLETGIDVEARPAGKKVKRLSLLSGGERSLAAVAMLVSIFKARPSPFYVMDEVEAALDDTNLSRLLTIFRELQQDSQLIIITHQKRTMEVADALYGVSMRGDGVTKVISQRLGERQEKDPNLLA
ncbi:MAG: chromosome segregation protein SMC [Micrococcaceae bacterium]